MTALICGCRGNDEHPLPPCDKPATQEDLKCDGCRDGLCLRDRLTYVRTMLVGGGVEVWFDEALPSPP